jgi:hypothetical protein
VSQTKRFLCAIVCLCVAIGLPLLSGIDAVGTWPVVSPMCIVVMLGLMRRSNWVEPAVFGAAIYVSASWAAIAVTSAVSHGLSGDPIFVFLHYVPGILLCGFWLGLWRVLKSEESLIR